MTFSIQTALESAYEILRSSPLTSDDPHLRIGLESQILLAHFLQKDRVFLHTYPQTLLTPTQTRHFFESIQKRALGYPIEYLTHKVNFYGREFRIDSHTLIPRPETEILVEKIQEILHIYHYTSIAEIGVGCGVIAITLALQNPQIHIYATDINPYAIALARENAIKFGVEKQITFFHTSLLQGSEHLCLDMIVANPPYIANSYTLPLSVRYEPKEALFGGEVGSEMLESIITLGRDLHTCFVCCEMGYDQKLKIQDFMREIPHKSLEFYKDLSGFDRGFILQFS